MIALPQEHANATLDRLRDELMAARLWESSEELTRDYLPAPAAIPA
tara:strand:- start:161456 stop:161593 length:138 start_codon:yes stop_codon:yes gene_type:complete